MAQAVEQYTPLDEDRWTLNQAFDHLTVTLGYSEERALREMEQQRLGGHLMVRVYKVVDGKLQSDPEYLPCKKDHKLVRHLGWVRPLGLKWGVDFRCTVYRQRVLELWPPHPPAAQTAPKQQPKDKAGPDPLNGDHPSAVQSSQDKSKREGPQVRHVRQALKELFPPNSQPPVDLTQKEILKRVNEQFFKPRGWKPASRDTLARVMGRRA
jgi:hypothetical protein